eukprot:jgi/Bigna1/127009/aug1.3_g1717
MTRADNHDAQVLRARRNFEREVEEGDVSSQVNKMGDKDEHLNLESCDGNVHEPLLQKDYPHSDHAKDEPSTPPSQWLAHLALIIPQLGLQNCNPVVFCLICHGIAGPLLCLISLCMDYGGKTPMIPQPRHAIRFIVVGVFMFLAQIMITAIAIQLKLEEPNGYKILGVLMACAGALFMVLYGANLSTGSSASSIVLSFFGVCYRLLASFIRIRVSFSMVFTALGVSNVEPLLYFLCEECKNQASSSPLWNVPGGAWYAFGYYIVFGSIISYILINWGNKYADASIVLAYTPLQPATSVILSWILISTGFRGNLQEPGYNILGLIGIVIGLGLLAVGIRQEDDLHKLKVQK